ncbi:GIY-YIG nuclease family protein [Novosphingobium sp.]|uniref:GIY-YIG nuclease family protein n=1 Tax=Novosphingobium sp. TaxID=1874826 RepID=UPI003B51F4FD
MARDFAPMVYLMASRRNGTLYVGVTSNLLKRVAQHRQGTFGGFTEAYAVKMLVWFEPHVEMASAILREKRIKKWRRTLKLELIETANPDWRDLATDYGFEPLHLDSRVRGNDS